MQKQDATDLPGPVSQPDTRKTVRLCYSGMVCISLMVNLSPLLFVRWMDEFGFSFEQLGSLVFRGFILQVFVILAGSGLVDRLGARLFAVLGSILGIAGLAVLTLPDWLGATPHRALSAGVMIMCASGGLFELMLSPTINAIPSNRKAQDMILLHGFYAIGQFLVILLTTLALFVLVGSQWRLAPLAWIIVPLATLAGFARVWMPRIVAAESRLRLVKLVSQPAFIVVVLAMIMSGAAELTIAQWISSFAERGLGYSKLAGDLGGFCIFALLLGIGRVWIGGRGSGLNLERTLMFSSMLAVAAYLVASLSPWAWLSLAGCAIAGLAVAPLWPGVLSLAAARYPAAGASMFAVLAAAGNVGCAVVPWMVGWVADRAGGWSWAVTMWNMISDGMTPVQMGLRTGLLLATASPIILIGLLRLFRIAHCAVSRRSRCPSSSASRSTS